jgi:hypothetical protein
MLTTTPKSKPDLIRAIQNTKISQFVIKDAIAKSDTQGIKRDLDTFIGNNTKSVSVIFIKET